MKITLFGAMYLLEIAFYENGNQIDSSGITSGNKAIVKAEHALRKRVSSSTRNCLRAISAAPNPIKRIDQMWKEYHDPNVVF